MSGTVRIEERTRERSDFSIGKERMHPLTATVGSLGKGVDLDERAVLLVEHGVHVLQESLALAKAVQYP